MSEVVVVPRSVTRPLELWVPATVVVFDQITKYLIRRSLPLHESVVVVPGFLDFTHVRNTGAAFGMLNGVDFPFKTAVIAVVALTALVGVAVYARGLAGGQMLARVGSDNCNACTGKGE